MKFKKTKKGVYFSFDAIIASVIFILTMISLLSYWYSVRETVMAEDSMIQEEAIRLSNMLFLYSEDGFGFAISTYNKTLNLTKLNEYIQMHNMEQIKSDISIPYDFQINFTKCVIQEGNPSCDSSPSISMVDPDEINTQNNKTISKVTRIAPFSDGTVAKVEIQLFDSY